MTLSELGIAAGRADAMNCPANVRKQENLPLLMFSPLSRTMTMVELQDRAAMATILL